MSKIKSFNDLAGGEELCKHCDWIAEGYNAAPGAVCEGLYCEEAYEIYVEEMEENN